MLCTALEILCSLRDKGACLSWPEEKEPSCGAAEEGRRVPILTLELIGDFSFERGAVGEVVGRKGCTEVCLVRGRRE